MSFLNSCARAGMRAGRTTLVLTALLLVALAGRAEAVRVVVDPAGGGDFTTIQAGLDSLVRDHAPSWTGDTLIILPGNYPESIHMDGPTLGWPNYVLCPGGRDSTRVQDVTHVYGATSRQWRIVGLSITNSVDLAYPPGGGGADWTDCRFDGGFSGDVGVYNQPGPNMHHCEFHGDVSITGYTSLWGAEGFNDLTFINATLVARNGIGGLTFDRCRFIDSPGWAATFFFSGDYYAPSGFRDCTFENCANGIDMPWARSGKENMVARCRFTNIPGTAVRCGDGTFASTLSTLILNLSNCFFDHCGQALEASIDGKALLAADTIVAATGSAIRARVLSADIRGLRVLGAGGDGIAVLRLSPPSYSSITGHLSVDDCFVTQTGGHGILVRDSLTHVNSSYGSDSVVACTASACGGDGVRMETVSANLLNCIAWANTGDGLSLEATLGPEGAAGAHQVVGNTSAANQGDGLRLARTPVVPAPIDVLQRNLVANNVGYGMRTTAPDLLTPASLAYNDAWQNGAGDYAGLTAAPDSNLAANPLFCSLASGDLTLQFGSPCGPSGAFGAIGARGEACTGGVGTPPATPAMAFSLRPNPARAFVEFALPAGIGISRLDVIDLQGRVRWSRNVGAGEGTVRWNGSSAHGPLEPGVYWARVKANGFEQRRRLVWLP